MAVAQAAVNATLDGPSSALEPLTASVKRGIKYADLLHLEDQLREESPHKEWICRKYSPHTVTRQNRVVETYKERPLSIEACLDEILARKIELHGDPSILLRLWGRHYSAFLHSGTHATLPDLDEGEAADDTSKGTTVKDESGTTLEKSTIECSSNSQSLSEDVSMEGPWDPTTWNGNVAELWQRMEGFSMHHELKREI
ncbi:hypothetical protein PC129_g21675 [Phytophthora cactorum]|uniref:Uncharacterized protein n=1 Tax=Phytophthora cactorum TaxID=29920 RepID=A0A8T1H529_9STRA|nr:hypothetical protein PC129_g21675 [Phytophthora cactorum]